MHKGKYVFSQLLDFLDKDVSSGSPVLSHTGTYAVGLDGLVVLFRRVKALR